jgi:hypothetical protein
VVRRTARFCGSYTGRVCSPQAHLSGGQLAGMQRILRQDEQQPLLLIAARDERATCHRFMEAIKPV